MHTLNRFTRNNKHLAHFGLKSHSTLNIFITAPNLTSLTYAGQFTYQFIDALTEYVTFTESLEELNLDITLSEHLSPIFIYLLENIIPTVCTRPTMKRLNIRAQTNDQARISMSEFVVYLRSVFSGRIHVTDECVLDFNGIPLKVFFDTMKHGYAFWPQLSIPFSFGMND